MRAKTSESDPGPARDTRSRILAVAMRRFRVSGAGVGIGRIMAEAGLTHGGFYAHFRSKLSLLESAFRAAAGQGRQRWTAGLSGSGRGTRLQQLAGRYLSRTHRDTPAEGCPFAALADSAARDDGLPRAVFQQELMASADAIAAAGGLSREQALGFLASCVGGILLARGVEDAALSDTILRSTRRSAIHGAGPTRPACPDTVQGERRA